MRYEYKSQNAVGQVSQGVLVVDDKAGLEKQLKLKKETLIFSREIKESKFSLDSINYFFSRVKLSEKIFFGKNLGTMIRSGLSLSRALSVLGKQTKNKRLKVIIASIVDDIARGTSLHSALGKFPDVFSSLFVSMVNAGEESGNLSESLGVITTQLDKTYTLRRKIRGAMVYPAIIITAMIIIMILMLIYVVPTLAATFAELGVELPATTQAIISVSNFLTNYTLIFFGGIVAFFGAFYAILKSNLGKRYFYFFLLRLPIISNIVKQANSARTTRTLSSLLSSGVDISEALLITKDVLENSYYKEVIEIAINNIQKGLPLSEAFAMHPNLYPVLATEMIEVGEETGSLPKMLIEVAEFYEGEVEAVTKDMSTIIEPILMVVIGAVVGFFALSMIEPMYSLSSSI